MKPASQEVDKVYYESEVFDLKTAIGRLQFLRELYNFASLVGDRDAILGEIHEPKDLKGLIERRYKKTFHGSNKPSTKGDGAGRPGNGGGANGGDGADAKGNVSEEEGADEEPEPPFEKAGYELVPERACNRRFKVQVFQNKRPSGLLLNPTSQLPRHIHRIRRGPGTNGPIYISKRLIYQNELRILQALHKKLPVCEQIIPLCATIVSDVGTYIVLPELQSVDEQVFVGGGVLRPHFVELSRDLARGVTFMHGNGIAHRDIKPGNLVFTENFHLRIIDFDTSLFVDGEDSQVSGYVGSEWWMAPEIGSEDDYPHPMYSPIRADRFSCGRVFEEFGRFNSASDEGLKAFAKRLMNENAKDRPKLSEWLVPKERMVEEAENDYQTTRSEDETLVGAEDETLFGEEVPYKEKMRERPLKRARFGCGERGVTGGEAISALVPQVQF